MPWRNQTLEQHRAAVARSQQRKLRFMRSVKAAAGCFDCGFDDWRALQFDHREYVEKLRNTKTQRGAGGTNLLRLGWHALQVELEKCDVVCANCHAIRTLERSW